MAAQLPRPAPAEGRTPDRRKAARLALEYFPSSLGVTQLTPYPLIPQSAKHFFKKSLNKTGLPGISKYAATLFLLAIILICACSVLGQMYTGELRLKVTDPSCLGLKASVQILSQVSQYQKNPRPPYWDAADPAQNRDNILFECSEANRIE